MSCAPRLVLSLALQLRPLFKFAFVRSDYGGCSDTAGPRRRRVLDVKRQAVFIDRVVVGISDHIRRARCIPCGLSMCRPHGDPLLRACYGFGQSALCFQLARSQRLLPINAAPRPVAMASDIICFDHYQASGPNRQITRHHNSTRMVFDDVAGEHTILGSGTWDNRITCRMPHGRCV